MSTAPEAGSKLDTVDAQPPNVLTIAISAATEASLSGYIYKNSATCPPAVPGDGPHSSTYSTWSIEAYDNGSTVHRRNGYLTFKTSVIGPVTAIKSASLRIVHSYEVGQHDAVQLHGGPQPVFGAALDGQDFYKATVLLGKVPMSTILAKGSAEFSIPASQINVGGHTQFRISLDRGCPYPLGNNYWKMVAPLGPASQVPILTVKYIL